MERIVGEIKRLPHCIQEVVAAATDPETNLPAGPVAEAAERHWHADFFLYLGRHIGLAVALEGALKLKEISYISTDAYAAGEMKHGPIALLEDGTPVVVVATDSPVKDKVVSNMQEVARARRARDRRRDRGRPRDRPSTPSRCCACRDIDWMLQPLLGTIPLQLLAYAIAQQARPERRPAAQPGEDRHGRVSGVGLDLLEIERLERAIERRPGLATRLFTDAERAYAASRARPGQHLAARFCAKEAVAKALGMQAWSWQDVEVPAGGEDAERRAARRHARRARASSACASRSR